MGVVSGCGLYTSVSIRLTLIILIPLVLGVSIERGEEREDTLLRSVELMSDSVLLELQDGECLRELLLLTFLSITVEIKIGELLLTKLF